MADQSSDTGLGQREQLVDSNLAVAISVGFRPPAASLPGFGKPEKRYPFHYAPRSAGRPAKLSTIAAGPIRRPT